MEADEMMDDDLFADLYGDDEPKKSTVEVKGPTQVANGASSTGPKSTAVNPPSAPVVKSERAADAGLPSGNQGSSGPAAQQVTSNEVNGSNSQENGNNGWNNQVKEEGNAANGNDFQGYGGYDQNENYGDYSGGTGGNMVDVGGSTAIKEDGKMFIGGLNWETTDESLKNYFSQFGEVTECTVMRDGTTGRSRGFGFLTFKDPKTVNIVMVKEHYLDGKIIDPKRAIPRDEQEKTSKIFVGGVSQEATEADFREYFLQFGRVLDATLMMDKDTGRPRGFGFVTFDSEGAVENALNHSNLAILGKTIEVKKAQPRGNPRDRNPGMGGAHYDDRDDRGGFRDRGDRRVDRFDRDGSSGGGVPAGGAYGQQGGGAAGGAVTGPPGIQGIYNGMTPQMLAQYWQRTMQQYMAAFMQQQQQQQQQQQAAAGRGRIGMPAGGVGAVAPAPVMPAINPMMMMNPAMMQQFQQMQQMQLAQQQGGGQGQQGQMGGGPGGGGMGGMQGMGMGMPGQQQQHQVQQMAHQGAQGSYGPQGAGGYGTQGGYDGSSGYDNQHHQQQQMHIQDPRFQRQAKDYQAHHQRDFNPQQPSSWEGMYDEVPPQQQQHMNAQMHQQQQQHHHQNQVQQQQQQQPRLPPAGPSSSSASSNNNTSGPPPNAPTGPRNARNPTGPAAYRGGSRIGGQSPSGAGGSGGSGGVGPVRGPGGFSRGGAVGGMVGGGVGGGHGYHPYARGGNNSGAGAGREY